VHAAPAVSLTKTHGNAHTSVQGQSEHSGISLRNGFSAYAAVSPAANLSVAAGLIAGRPNNTPSPINNGREDATQSPSARRHDIAGPGCRGACHHHASAIALVAGRAFARPVGRSGLHLLRRSSSAVASQPAMAGFQPWLHQPCIDSDFVTRNRVPHRPLNKADLDLIHRNC
jgi:hypothetical protein